MGKSISIQPANSVDLRKAIFGVRRSVFVVEQNVSESEEYDEFEASSTHFAAVMGDVVVGTCRYRSTAGGTVTAELCAVSGPGTPTVKATGTVPAEFVAVSGSGTPTATGSGRSM